MIREGGRGPTGCQDEMRSPSHVRDWQTPERSKGKWRNCHAKPERGHSGLDPDVPTWKQLLPQGRGAGQRLPECPGRPPCCPSLSPWLHGALHAFSSLYLLLFPNLATIAQTKRHQSRHQNGHLISFGAWPRAPPQSCLPNTTVGMIQSFRGCCENSGSVTTSLPSWAPWQGPSRDRQTGLAVGSSELFQQKLAASSPHQSDPPRRLGTQPRSRAHRSGGIRCV